MIRVLLADDHETVREGLRLLIDAQPDMTVVGEAADGHAARRHRPQRCAGCRRPRICDAGMNGLAAREGAERRRAAGRGRGADAPRRRRVRAGVAGAGASGYVLKQSPSTELLEAIRAAAAGGRYPRPGTAAARLPARTAAGGAGPPTTDRARDGGPAHDGRWATATRTSPPALDLSVKTVEVHKANAMRKLGSARAHRRRALRRAQRLAARSLSTGFPQLPPPRPGSKLTALMDAEQSATICRRPIRVPAPAVRAGRRRRRRHASAHELHSRRAGLRGSGL